jgi:hypothetical protein
MSYLLKLEFVIYIHILWVTIDNFIKHVLCFLFVWLHSKKEGLKCMYVKCTKMYYDHL